MSEQSVNVGSFNVGIRWKYPLLWKAKLTKKSWLKLDPEHCVSPRFSDFKTEIMEYGRISVKIYKTEIMQKSEQYVQTKLVRSMKHGTWRSDRGIERVSIKHLQCIILYTDYSELSTDFSATFRPIHTYEPLAVTKNRHSRYYWLSSGLQELMYKFGQRHGKGNGSLDPLLGPFFTGMSFVMTLPQFSMTLYGPTSTTIHKEVATRFSGSEGMLIEFHTKSCTSETKGFDVSWISRYGLQEDERYVIIYCCFDLLLILVDVSKCYI